MEASRSVGRAVPLKGWLDELLVIVLVIVALILGWALKSWVQGQTVSFTSDDGVVSLRYPADWLEQVNKGALLAVSDVRAEGVFKPAFSVAARELNPDFPLTPRELVVTMSVQRAEELTGYRVLSVDPATVDGIEATTVSYAYVAEPAGSLQQTLPVVVEAVDWVVIHEDKAYVFTFAAESANFAQEERTFNSILASVELE